MNKEILDGGGDGAMGLKVDLGLDFAIGADLADEIAAHDLGDAHGEFFPCQRPDPVEDEEEDDQGSEQKPTPADILLHRLGHGSLSVVSISDSGIGL